jgi:hypothetical protein
MPQQRRIKSLTLLQPLKGCEVTNQLMRHVSLDLDLLVLKDDSGANDFSVFSAFRVGRLELSVQRKSRLFPNTQTRVSEIKSIGQLVLPTWPRSTDTCDPDHLILSYEMTDTEWAKPRKAKRLSDFEDAFLDISRQFPTLRGLTLPSCVLLTQKSQLTVNLGDILVRFPHLQRIDLSALQLSPTEVFTTTEWVRRWVYPEQVCLVTRLPRK